MLRSCNQARVNQKNRATVPHGRDAVGRVFRAVVQPRLHPRLPQRATTQQGGDDGKQAQARASGTVWSEAGGDVVALKTVSALAAVALLVEGWPRARVCYVAKHHGCWALAPPGGRGDVLSADTCCLPCGARS